MSSAPALPFAVRHVQLVRALIAAIAAAMVTFAPDKSYEVGLTIFSGFAIASGLLLVLSAFLVDDRSRRGPYVLIGAFDLVAGMFASALPLHSSVFLLVLLISWAGATGIAEFFVGVADRRAGRDRALARDHMFAGGLAVLLAIVVAFVPPSYSLDYFIEEAGQTFNLSGQIILIGLFGGYAAIAAVYLAIAGLSPQQPPAADASAPAETPHEKDHA